MKLVLAVVGAVVGAVFGSLFYHKLQLPGGVVGALFGFLLGSMNELRERISHLEQEMTVLRRQERPLAAPQVKKEAPPSEELSRPDPVPPRPEPMVKPSPQTPPQHTEQIDPSSFTADFAWEKIEKPQSLLLEKLQSFFRGNLLVKAGVVILFFGVAFLVKFAAEHSLLPIELRLAATAAGAVALIAIGWRLRVTRTGYGLVLQGGGIGILYLTIFAAFRLYDLLPASLALGLLVFLCLFSSALAIFQDSLSLAQLGASGGFIAPVLCSTGGGSHVALFSYYAVLNTGILIIAWYKAWRPLNLTGFIFTFAIGGVWGGKYYQPAYFSSVEPFLILFFLMYVAVAVLFALRHPTKLKGIDGTLVFGTPIIAFSLQALMVHKYDYGLAFSALAVGGFYLIIANLLYRLRPELFRLLAKSFLAFGVVFATLTIPLAFDGRWTSAAWAVEGAALVWLGLRLERKSPWIFGSLLIVGSGFFFLDDFPSAGNLIPVLNHACVGMFLIALSSLTAAWHFFAKSEENEGAAVERALSILLFIWGIAWWAGCGIREVREFVQAGHVNPSLAVFAAATALLASEVSRRLDWNYPLIAAFLHLPAMVLVTFLTISEEAFLVSGGGFIAWPLAFTVQYLLLARHNDEFPQPLLSFFHAATLWLLVFHLSHELREWADLRTFHDSSWSVAALAVPTSLALFLLSRPRDKWLPSWQPHHGAYLSMGTAPLVLFLFVWSFSANIISSGDPFPLAYIPLVNPLDIAMACGFLSIAAWRLAYRDAEIADSGLGHAVPIAFVAAIFFWLNAILLRAIHHYALVPYRPEELFRSNLVQASLSLFWTVLALCTMVAAHRTARRLWWIAGGVLLGIVVLKLFLVDLSHTGTLARIVSFVGVGILLLLIGYLTPIPPEQKETGR